MKNNYFQSKKRGITVRSVIITLLLLITAIMIAQNMDRHQKVKNEYHESVKKITRITNSDSTGLKYSDPAWSADGKYLAFRDNKGDLYIADMNGKLIKKIVGTRVSASPAGLNWSRDGRFIAYLSHPAVRVLDLQNYAVKEVVRDRWLSAPFWIYSDKGQKVSTINDMGVQYFSEELESNIMFPEKILNRNVVYISVRGDTYFDENGQIIDSIKLARLIQNFLMIKRTLRMYLILN